MVLRCRCNDVVDGYRVPIAWLRKVNSRRTTTARVLLVLLHIPRLTHSISKCIKCSDCLRLGVGEGVSVMFSGTHHLFMAVSSPPQYQPMNSDDSLIEIKLGIGSAQKYMQTVIYWPGAQM
jgi:hypothetical protein